ncbi:hypothetical protein Pelo_16352 [Pelomyxa schiedti]|nr:hypothetical protein Pelo_16352 [Pelomyxa schiedti]
MVLVTTSPRCGGKSAARIMGWHLVRQMWRDWVISAKRVFVIMGRAYQQGDDDNEDGALASLKVVVSPIILGLIDVGALKNDWVWGEHYSAHDDDDGCICAKSELPVMRIPITKRARFESGECNVSDENWLVEYRLHQHLFLSRTDVASIESVRRGMENPAVNTVSRSAPLGTQVAHFVFQNFPQVYL